jgi:hypothetical protein
VTDAERIATLRRAGFRRSVIAAMLGVTVDQIQQVIEDPANAPPLQLVGSVPDVQNALTNGVLTVPAAPPEIVARDFVSLGDTNGIFYYLGTNGLSQAFSNPYGVSVTATDSGEFSPWNPTPTPEYLTDRDSTVNIFHSSAHGGVNWVMWDFGTAHAVKLRDYTVKNRWDQGLYFPTRFVLEGSHDGSAWDAIDDSTVNYTTLDQWARPAVDHPDLGPYRYIRLSDPNDVYLVLGEVELYGDLYTYP